MLCISFLRLFFFFPKNVIEILLSLCQHLGFLVIFFLVWSLLLCCCFVGGVGLVWLGAFFFSSFFALERVMFQAGYFEERNINLEFINRLPGICV